MPCEVVSRGRKHLIERDPAWQPGRYRATFTIHDQHYHDGSQWQPVDESLADDPTDGYAKACTNTQHMLRIGNGGTRRWYPRRNVLTEYVSITDIEYWHVAGGGSWRHIALPTPVWRSQGADWDLSNLSASLTNTWKRIKAAFVLKDATAPTRLRFAITLVGLTLGADWKLRNGTNEVVGSIDPPTAEDANGAAVPVAATYAGGYIEWSVTPGSATYPVTIDPTFTDGPSGDTNTACDDGCQNAAPNDNRGTCDNIHVRANRKMLLRFILDGIEATAACNSATLYLTVGFEPDTNSLTAYHISNANGDWIEGTKDNATAGTNEPCWNYKAYNTTEWAGSAGLSTSSTDYDASALGSMSFGNAATDPIGTQKNTTLTTSVVQGWFGQSTNNGMVLVGNAVGYPMYATSDHATTGYRPKLVVDYTTTAPTLVIGVDEAGALLAGTQGSESAQAQAQSASAVLVSVDAELW